MAAVLGVWIGLAGAVAMLTGVTGLRRHRWLRRHGAKVWAVAVPQSGDDGEQLVALEYTLPDGRVLERLSAGNAVSLPPGHSVLIWYDPADPQETLVYGRRGWPVNVGFVAIGAVLEAVAIAIGVLGALYGRRYQRDWRPSPR